MVINKTSLEKKNISVEKKKIPQNLANSFKDKSLPRIIKNNKTIQPNKLQTLNISNKNANIKAFNSNSSIKSVQTSISSEILDKKKALISDQSWKEKLESLPNDSMEILASSIKNIAKNDIEKAWCLFHWIGHNIEYDVEGYFSGNLGDNSPEAVWKRRKSVCEGYAGLFKNLSDLLGLECVSISGYAKGYSYKIGQDVSQSNHAWNAIKMQNQWYLIDATWGAGHLSGKEFKFDFNPFYFLTPPEYFIFAHLPTNPKFQYLKNPWSQKKYQNMIKVNNNFFDNEIELISPTINVINAKKDLTIKMKLPKNVDVLVKLLMNGQIIENMTSIETQEEFTLIKATFPKKGEYNLDIYSIKSDGSFQTTRTFTQTLCYKINSNFK